jgi:hypothetical protein
LELNFAVDVGSELHDRFESHTSRGKFGVISSGAAPPSPKYSTTRATLTSPNEISTTISFDV